jgi:hypothetical protein
MRPISSTRRWRTGEPASCGLCVDRDAAILTIAIEHALSRLFAYVSHGVKKSAGSLRHPLTFNSQKVVVAAQSGEFTLVVARYRAGDAGARTGGDVDSRGLAASRAPEHGGESLGADPLCHDSCPLF